VELAADQEADHMSSSATSRMAAAPVSPLVIPTSVKMLHDSMCNMGSARVGAAGWPLGGGADSARSGGGKAGPIGPPGDLRSCSQTPRSTPRGRGISPEYEAEDCGDVFDCGVSPGAAVPPSMFRAGLPEQIQSAGKRNIVIDED